MKKPLILFLITVVTTLNSYAQEFIEDNSGLMYSNEAIQKLKPKVDSITFKFLSEKIKRQLNSNWQAKADYIEVSTTDTLNAKTDFENGLPLNSIKKKYTSAIIERHVLLTKTNTTDYYGKEGIVFYNTDNYDHSFSFMVRKDLPWLNHSLTNKWAFRQYGRTFYGFYIVAEFKAEPLNKYYSSLVEYSERLIDTSAHLYLETAKSEGGLLYDLEQEEKTFSKKGDEFVEYIHKATHMPKLMRNNKDKRDFIQYLKAKDDRIDRLSKKDKQFHQQLKTAYEDVLKNGGSSMEFEEYVGKYYSKRAQLNLMRNVIIIGNCSQDDAPQKNVLRIARFAASIGAWDVFIHAHLEIINDVFSRQKVGNYSKKEREECLNALELLGVNTIDLLLGTALHVDDASKNHYFGDISIIGRALAETKYPDLAEQKMEAMITDASLDLYNRMLVYYLYKHYISHIPNEEQKIIKTKQLKNTIQKFPPYIRHVLQRA